MNNFTALFLLLQTPEPVNWWTSFSVGESIGFDWLLFLFGSLFAGVAGYATYSTMLYNVIASNRHPANFRKIVLALVLLIIIIWFVFVFRAAFGGLIALILLALWGALAVMFLFSKRQVTSS